MGKRDWVSLGELVPGVLAAWEECRHAPINSIQELWPGVVGRDVAMHAFPTALEDGVLFISVDSSVWSFELAQRGLDQLMDALNNRLGSPGIRRLAFTAHSSLPPNDSEEIRHA